MKKLLYLVPLLTLVAIVAWSPADTPAIGSTYDYTILTGPLTGETMPFTWDGEKLVNETTGLATWRCEYHSGMNAHICLEQLPPGDCEWVSDTRHGPLYGAPWDHSFDYFMCCPACEHSVNDADMWREILGHQWKVDHGIPIRR